MGEPQAVTRVGIIGAGAISAQYFEALKRLPSLELVAIADIDSARAEAAAQANGARAMSVAELLASPDVDAVINLTIPASHAEVALAAIAQGKSVYGEKPLALNVAEGRQILEAAQAAGVRVGCAPDTVLGTGIQTARQAIEDGLIGAPVSAVATMVTAGHERWHPNPDFYYVPGGGPLLDMGPYYITALVHLLGPVTSVIGAASRSRDSRTIASGPRTGEVVPVTIDTHVTGVLTHANGALSTLVMSFDAVASQASRIEVHGVLGSLQVPDPNHFDGDVRVHSLDDQDWRTLEPSAGYQNSGRGYGLADLVATPEGNEPRAGGQLALHVLEVMESVLNSAKSGQSIAMTTSVQQPSPVPLSQLP